MKNVIIINHDPLIKRIKDGFCIDYLIEHDVKVQYLDLSNFYFPSLKVSYQCNEEYVVKLDTEKQILDYLKTIDISNTIFICEALPNWKSRNIYRFLSDHNALVIKISIYALSSFSKRSLFSKIKLLKPKDLFQVIRFKLYKKIHRVKIWDTIISSNKDIKSKWRINHPDYEYFLQTVNVNPSDDYIVFLDECFPTHPEIKYWFGEDLSFLADSYHKSLTDLFDYLEDTFKKEVIVCAHPKSSYKGNEFGTHKIVKGETARYVRRSYFTMMHVSSSSTYAVLNNKPIFILTSPEYKKNIKSILTLQKEFAEAYGLEIKDINTWRPKQNDIQPLVPEIREAFISNFLTDPKNEGALNGEIIYKILCELSQKEQ